MDLGEFGKFKEGLFVIDGGAGADSHDQLLRSIRRQSNEPEQEG